MAQRIVNQTVIVVRDGKRVVPQIGQPFDFTPAELKDIEALQPSAVRKLINESEAKDGEPAREPDVAAAKPAGGKAASKQATVKAADKEVVNVNKSDGNDGL